MNARSAAELEQLFARSSWARRLARSLVRDAHAAEDLVQDAWVAALERAPASESAWSRWLASVLANLARKHWRSASRRDARERCVARVDSAAPEHESLEQFELFRELADEVRALDEPYRSTLILRYFDELSPREVASRQRVPVRTVHTRTTRALELVRARLDRKHGGDRSRWLAAFVPFAGFSRPYLFGALIVNAKAKVAVVCLVLALLAVFWYVRSAHSIDVAAPATHAADIAKLDATSELASCREASEPRGAPSIALAETPAVESKPIEMIHGIVITPDDRPVPDVSVVFRATKSSPPLAGVRVTSDTEGRFELQRPERKDGFLDVAGTTYTVVLQPSVSNWGEDVEYVLMVESCVPLEGHVVDPTGAPLAACEVRLQVPDLRAEVLRILDESDDVEWSATTDATGRFEIASAPNFRTASLSTRRTGYRTDVRDLFDAQRGGLTITLEPESESPTIVRGSVVDPDGKPVGGALVGFAPKCASHMARTNALGEFAIDAVGGFDEQPIRCIEARGKGFLPGRVQRAQSGERPWPVPLVIRLDGPTLSIEGRLIDEQGAPVPHARVDSLDRRPLFSSYDEVVGNLPDDEESVLAGHSSGSIDATDERGHFEIQGLFDRAYRLRFFDARSLEFFTSDPIDAGTRGVVLRFASGERHERVAGRIVDRNGHPHANSFVSLSTSAERVAAFTSMTRNFSWRGEAIRTGDDGKFEFRGVSKEIQRIGVTNSTGLGGAQYEIRDYKDLEHLELVAPGVYHAQIDLRGSGLEANFARVAGKKDDQPWIAVRRGGVASFSDFVKLVDGRSPAFTLPDSATAIVLEMHDADDRPRTAKIIPLRLERDILNIIRP